MASGIRQNENILKDILIYDSYTLKFSLLLMILFVFLMGLKIHSIYLSNKFM